MAAENSLKDTEFSKLDDEPILQTSKTSPDSKTSDNEMSFVSDNKWEEIASEITNEHLKFINSQIMVRFHKIEKSIERLEEKQWKVLESKKEQTIDSDTESDKVVKQELESLIKKYGIKDLTYALDSISSNRSLTKKIEQK